MQRFVLVIEYIGTNYAGSQIQTVKGKADLKQTKAHKKQFKVNLKKYLAH
jgi:tRNA U38,U39,U40 pseudouridine synthase TruA